MTTQLQTFIPDPLLYRLNLDTYHRIIEADILKADQRIELIDGVLCNMSPIGIEHASTNKRLIHLFSQLIKNDAILAVQAPLILPEHSEPKPDLMLLRPRSDFYEQSHPTPKDTLLIIEIAASSLHYDRTIKMPLYAAHGVSELWLIDLTQHKLEMYRDLGLEGYRQILLPDYEQIVAPLLLPEMKIKVSSLW